MKQLLSKAGLIGILIAFVAASFCFSAQAAVKTKIKYSTTDPGQTISKTTLSPGDVPGHELSQVVTVRNYNVSNPDYDVKETWVYEQSDTITGTGSAKGPNIDILKNGDKAYYICEAALKTITKEDKSWETAWEGKCQFTGGTGKIKSIKGGLTFKGKATPEQPFFEEGEYEVEY